MSKLKIGQFGSLIFGFLCLFLLYLNNPLKNLNLFTLVKAQKTETQSAKTTTVPYRRVVNFPISNGSSNALAAISDIPPNKKFYIKFASIRVTVPSATPDKKVTAGITCNGVNAFMLLDQGVVSGYQNFVATHSLDIAYESGAVNSGIYVNRNSTAGISNVSVYLVGELEQ